MSDVVTVTKEGAIATVTLNRPEARNALNDEMRSCLAEAVNDLDKDDALRVVILKGAGAAFSAGADIRQGSDKKSSDLLLNHYRPTIDGIANSPKVWIGQLHGATAGISAAIAQSCDLVAMAEDAFIYTAFSKIALVPDGGNTWFLLQKLGYQKAFELITLGGRLSASECQEIGLANLVAPESELETLTFDLATRMAATAPLATLAAKRILRSIGATDLAATYEMEAEAQDALRASQDHREGIAAFSEKRAPIFNGK
ncbi:MAG: enoyl-CoA hydratase-related protein [Paracoccaceae bacterium]|nr:enoyl-CoA hydratase-related protein [Paracoccaceae bacterium]MDG1737625.1 enoyl-CoA hydratase-related protein [Paracoccaceae bacterium]MDG2257696.1 enoyl-CoA hydratase-related protein [Paracoccaceae bacterium]